MVARPDGNLARGVGRDWSNHNIGTITHFAVPGAPHVNSIAVGPDGALWFTEFNTDKIDALLPQAQLPNSVFRPQALGPDVITQGADGAMWFTRFLSKKIGRITDRGSTPPPQTVPTVSEW